MIPILIRVKDRPFYLNTTLASLTATNLNDYQIFIVDDCSTTDIMNEYLFTDHEITLPNFNWYGEITSKVTEKGSVLKNDLNLKLSNKEIWDKYIGNIPIKTQIKGLKNRFNVLQPKNRNGVLAGLLWTIFMGFSLFKNANKIVILEDDLIFNKYWLDYCNLIFNKVNNNSLGCVSVYNREKDFNVNYKINDYYENPNIGGVIYMIPRNVFNIMNSDGIFDLSFSNLEVGGDTYFQKWLFSKNLKIYNSVFSFIQHIGIQSTARPGRFLRYSKNFVQPFAWNEDF